MEAAPSGGRKRQWQWRFPAPMARPCTAAAAAA